MARTVRFTLVLATLGLAACASVPRTRSGRPPAAGPAATGFLFETWRGGGDDELPYAVDAPRDHDPARRGR